MSTIPVLTTDTALALALALTEFGMRLPFRKQTTCRVRKYHKMLTPSRTWLL